MALDDSGESTNHSADQPAPADFDMEFVPDLPDGRAVFPAEREGKFVWLVAEGAMTEQCFHEMRTYLLHIVGSGTWTQNWSGGEPQLV
ncbi:hypothetical protein [Streptomyces anthocyanicus]|uniref:hypothetical protein n=1 Tax=Streptomyces anthocyanicus TaxID=68174 RepID=UPI0038045D5C